MTMHYAWIIACTGTLVLMLTTGFGKLSYSLILPSMKSGLALTYTQAGLIGTANMVGYLPLALIGGFVAVRFGSRRTVFISLMVMGISLFLTGMSHSFAFALLMRFITGMGNGAAVVPMLSLTAPWFSARKRGLAAGIITAGVGIGLSLGGLFIPFLVTKFGPDGWRYAWFVLGGIVFAFSFVCYAFLRDSPAEKGTSMYGGVEERRDQGAISIFSAWKEVTKRKEVWNLGVLYFIFGFSYIIYMTFIVAYLAGEGGLSPQAAGKIFAALGLASIVSGMLWGWISDSIGRRYGLALAYATLALACLICVFWRSSAGFYLSAGLFGFTLACGPSIMTATIGDLMEERLVPAALGVIAIVFGIGQALGPFVGGWMKDSTGTFAGVFMFSAVALLIGAGGALMLMKSGVVQEKHNERGKG
jgi:MFS family permease